MRTIHYVLYLVFPFLIVALAFGQAPLEFEVASIRPVASLPTGGVAVGLTMDGAQARFVSLSLKDYIAMAYRIRTHQISGPDWLASERFDIAAKLPENATTAQIPGMLQTLLTDRFQMKTHHETQELPVYALEIAKGGPKMTEAPMDAEGAANDNGAVNVAAGGNAAGAAINFGRGSSFSFGDNRLEGRKLTMTTLANSLARFVDRPIIDMTELQGSYDLVLELSPEDYRAMLIRSAINAGVVLPPQALRALDQGTGDSLSNALQKAGLKLEPRKSALDVLVIDTMQKKPTDN